MHTHTQNKTNAHLLHVLELLLKSWAWRIFVVQVSEKIVLLDEEARKLRSHEAESETRAEQLQADKKALLSTNEALRTEVCVASVRVCVACVCV